MYQTKLLRNNLHNLMKMKMSNHIVHLIFFYVCLNYSKQWHFWNTICSYFHIKKPSISSPVMKSSDQQMVVISCSENTENGGRTISSSDETLPFWISEVAVGHVKSPFTQKASSVLAPVHTLIKITAHRPQNRLVGTIQITGAEVGIDGIEVLRNIKWKYIFKKVRCHSLR